MDTSVPESHSLRTRAEAFWKTSGGRLTFVRSLLCDAVETFDSAFTPEELLLKVRKRDPQIAISSVYRMLGQLTEAGLLVSVEGRDGSHQYSIAQGSGNSISHVVCMDCGKSIPVANPCLSLREADAALREGFLPKKTTLRVEASCESFQQTGKCQRTKDTC